MAAVGHAAHAHARGAVLLVAARGIRGDTHGVDGVVGVSCFSLNERSSRPTKGAKINGAVIVIGSSRGTCKGHAQKFDSLLTQSIDARPCKSMLIRVCRNNKAAPLTHTREINHV